ncbi:NAD(+) diphosphatase [Salaquimonas pukyongi]|uniref:NAD(+) diphosphatase n=1 Tax=Salaquimonas pukyongi TaxID=2712698 RepID=UPI001FCDB700|nr:NAD(+) diphosphatase [Salaquimonas pukyongi]
MPAPDKLSSDPFFNTAFPEPSHFVGFGRNELVRDAENRDETTLNAALAETGCRFYLYSGNKVLIDKGAESRVLFDLEEARRWGGKPQDGVLLGHVGDGPRIALQARIAEECLTDPYRLYDFRSLLYSSSVREEDMGAIAQGGSLLHWISVHRFCGRCGSPTRTEIGGYRISCTKCHHTVFPRTDPVVIMLAVRGNKCLLGRSPHFPEGWYSTLAGFVEPGETIEDAVRRETLEESGVLVRRVRYFASQPWPFPHSLMIGVHCEAVSENITFQQDELEDCRWFSRQDVRQMIAETHPEGVRCPPTRAIAHALIKAWVEAG